MTEAPLNFLEEDHRHGLHVWRRAAMHLAAFVFAMAICAGLSSARADETEHAKAVERLYDAFAKSSDAAYVAEIAKPSMPDFPNVTRAVFYRKPNGNGRPLLRVDLYRQKELAWSFIQNDKGKFAIHHEDGKAAQGGDFLCLYYLECMLNPPFRQEIEQILVNVENREVNGRKCTFITTKVPDVEVSDNYGFSLRKKLAYLNPADDVEALKEIHPFVREFAIDSRQGVIFQIRKYNAHGKMLFSRSLGNVDFSPNWSKYKDAFDSPEFIDYTVETTRQFMKALARDKGRPSLRQMSERAKPPKADFWQSLLKRLDFTRPAWKYAFAAIGIASLACAWWFRRRSFK